MYLDTYIIILKQAYECLTQICNPLNNYVIYNASRIKLSCMLKEADLIVKNTHYNGLPVFQNEQCYRKSINSIKFPLMVPTKENETSYIDDYFKIKLMKLSMEYLKLDKYCQPILNKGEKLSLKTSPIPPSNCAVGKIPDRNMYTEKELIQCWDINYHLCQFENAMYNIMTTKEIMCNYSKFIEIKEELCSKIKISNTKTNSCSGMNINHDKK